MDRIVNGINLDAYTLCVHCQNRTHSFVSCWGDKPVCCMGCKGSKEEGKHRVRHEWQDDYGNDTRPSGLFEARRRLKDLVLKTRTETPETMPQLKMDLRRLLDDLP